MRTLVIFYSLTGNTRQVGKLLAARLQAETAEITCSRYRGGLGGGLRQAWDVLTGGNPPIDFPPVDLDRYDLIVAGGPVWAGRPAPPLRSFVTERLQSWHRIGLFVTCNGTARNFPGEKALRELASRSASTPVTVRMFKEAEIHSPELADGVDAFVAALQADRKPTVAATG